MDREQIDEVTHRILGVEELLSQEGNVNREFAEAATTATAFVRHCIARLGNPKPDHHDAHSLMREALSVVDAYADLEERVRKPLEP